MKFDCAANTMLITVTELSSYAFRRENTAILMKRFGFTKTVITPDTYDHAEKNTASPIEHGTALHNVSETDAALYNAAQTEVPLEKNVTVHNITVSVQGFADIISSDGDVHTVEEIKTVGYLENSLTPFSDPSHFAQACIYACLLAESANLGEVQIKLTYIRRSNGAKVSFNAVFSREFLLRMFNSLLDRASEFIKITAERYSLFPREVSVLPFPYRTIRDGQERFIKEAYRAIHHGEALLVSAPTGIGKTISALYPAVKAVGGGKIDRIFYFTAKNVAGMSALHAAEEIAVHAPHFRAVMIRAKEQLCPVKRENPSFDLRMQCRFCEKIDEISDDLGKTYSSYRERELDALICLLHSDKTIYTPEKIREVSEKYRVCPYELSLDLSEYCTLIVCDYNYALDENVRFKRYFKDVKRLTDEKYVFLFDEAHNLPDRTRNTYSAILTSETVRNLSALCETYFSEDSEFIASVDELNSAMSNLSEECSDDEYVLHGDDGEEKSGGFLETDTLPVYLVRAVGNTASLMMRRIRDGGDASELLSEPQRKLSKFVFCAGFFDKRFRFFAHRAGDDISAEILCLDPSGILRAVTGIAKSTIIFSATLSPLEYFNEVTGLKNASVLELESPYERDNLCLIAYDSISTRYSNRRQTAEECAEVIAEAISAKCGNYIVYFPSYDYMKRVCRLFAGIMPECAVVMQRPGMSYRERERFIGIFHERAGLSDEYTVGFCVLGGMFSEGIDLSGESLIGAVIVGTGMPQISAERNIMAAYYDEKTERGRDFAYTCPGMNKVLQAAGRVIRSENDRGMVLLIDDRFGDASMKALFPRHWRHMRFTGDIFSMRTMLDEFWGRNDGGNDGEKLF